jgi:hypothetical protein
MTPRQLEGIRDADTTHAVADALEEVCEQFGYASIDIVGDQLGGAFVVIDRVNLGASWATPESWLGFHITHLHPAADVYPHYVRPDLARIDGQPLGVGLAPIIWVHGNRSAVQVSRRSNQWNPILDTPARKAVKVLDWLARQ